MLPQISDGRTAWRAGFLGVFVSAVISLTSAAGFAAEPPDPDELLNEAFAALQSERYERGLELLDRAQDAGPYDPRISFYRGYALEKLGDCSGASDAYARAHERGSDRLEVTAHEAWTRVDTTCVTVGEVDDMSRGTGRVGWKIFGWTSTVLGAVALITVPLKRSTENAALDDANTYFELRYGCTVERDGVTGENCDEAALAEDEGYHEYQKRAEEAERTTSYLLYGGLGLAGLGIGTLLTVALTRPAAAEVALAPSADGLHVGVTFRF